MLKLKSILPIFLIFVFILFGCSKAKTADTSTTASAAETTTTALQTDTTLLSTTVSTTIAATRKTTAAKPATTKILATQKVNIADNNRDTSKYVYPISSTVFRIAKINKSLSLADDWAPYLKDENSIYVMKDEQKYVEVFDRKYLSAKVFGFHDGRYLYFYGVVNDVSPMMNYMPFDNLFRGDAVELAFADVKGANLKYNSQGKYFKYLFCQNTGTGEKISDGRRTSGIYGQGPMSLINFEFNKYDDNKGYWFRAIIDTTKTFKDNKEISEIVSLQGGVTEAYFGMFIDNSVTGKALDNDVCNVMWTGHVNRSLEFNKIIFEK